MILEKQPELLADAIRAASEYYHIAPVYIEKDYWISKILQQLSRSVYMENTVFKGGTSLSKGYGLINRFSEDVDVAVLTQKLSGLYQYPASVHDPLFDFVANRVVVEINSFANPYPYVRRQIKSFITSYLENTGMDSFIEEYDLHPFELNILDKRRTLCEKVVSLLRFSFMDNPVQGLTGKIRHFYDIYFLLDDRECMEYVEQDFIKDLQELAAHDRQMFDSPEKWKHTPIKESPLLGSFNELWKQLGGYYERELNYLAYSRIPDANQVGKKLHDFISIIENKI